MSSNLQEALGGNVCLANFALTGLSGAATTYSSSAVSYALDGRAYTKAAVAGGATPTTDAVSGAAMTLTANKAAVFAWCLNAAGTVQVIKGPTANWTDTTANSTVVLLPEIPPTSVLVAYVVIKGGSTVSGTWTFGSSNWNATGIVIDAVVNRFSLPVAPILTA